MIDLEKWEGKTCIFCGGRLSNETFCRRCENEGELASVEMAFGSFVHLVFDDVWVRINLKKRKTEISTGYEQFGPSLGSIIVTFDGFPLNPTNVKEKITKLRSFQ